MTSKNKEYNIGANLERVLNYNIKSRKHIIELLIETVLQTISNIEYTAHNDGDKFLLNVGKMQRFIYIRQKQIVSIANPFTTIKDENNVIRFIFKISHDTETIDIDENICYKILRLNANNWFSRSNDFEDMYDKLELFEEIFSDDKDDKKHIRMAFKMLEYLMTYEVGYLRFDDDDDINRVDEIFHPQYHLDINYTSSATYKIGLKKTMEYLSFEKVINNSLECLFLSH